MITKRNGNGQTECVGCKEKGKFALNWDSFLYTFNNKPYCFECLMEKLENLQNRIDKAIECIEKSKNYVYDAKRDEKTGELIINDKIELNTINKNKILNILKGDDE